jgi:L-ribulose-5-phosphate 4-epimerase
MQRFSDIREECCAANKSLPTSGLVDLTFGNVSVCDRQTGVLAIKPSGVDYSALTPDDMVIVDFDGKVVEGTLNPSSDTPTHRCLFLAFSDIRSVVHTHSRKAVAFAQAAREIPLLGTTHADYFRGPVPLTRALTPEEIASAYEWETGKVIVERFANSNPNDIPAVLVRNHGPFAWGPSAAKAVENALALEIVADMAFHALTLAPDAAPPALALSEKHFLRKHGATATYGQKKS